MLFSLFIFFLIFIVVGFVAYRFPLVFLVIYLVVFTRAFGFLEEDTLKSIGIPNLLFCLNFILLILSSYFICFRKNKLARTPYTLALLFWLYGLIYPFVTEDSDLINSLTDGKDMLAYFLVSYLISVRRRINHSAVIKLVVVSGSILSVITLVFITTGIHPPEYAPVSGAGDVLKGLHTRFASLIALALIVVFGASLKTRITPTSFFLILLFVLALGLQGHRAIFLCTLTVLLLTPLFLNQQALRIRLLMSYMIGSLLLTMIAFNHIDNYIVKPVTEIINQDGGSFIGRATYDAQRWNYIYQSPLMGYGFINEESKLGLEFGENSTSRFSSTMGSVDSGYVDILIRFGIVGLLIMSVIYFQLIPYLYRRLNTSNALLISLVLYILSMFGTNITWSVFTYIFGIVPISLAYFFVLHEVEISNVRKPLADVSR